VARYEKAKGRIERIEELSQARRAKRELLNSFLATLFRQNILTEFDETLWLAVVDNITIYSADNIQFTYRDGTVIKA